MQVVNFGGELLLIALSGEPVVDWESHKRIRTAKSSSRANKGPHFRQCGSPATATMFSTTFRLAALSGRGYEAGRANLWNWIPAPFTEDVEDRISAAVID